MVYKNPNSKSPSKQVIRFPNHIKWEVHMVRTIDDEGFLRLAMTIAKPKERITLELRPSPPASERIERSAEIIEKHIVEETFWYARPEVVRVEEQAVLELLEARTSMPGVEFELSVNNARLKNSQKNYESIVKTQPLWLNLGSYG